ncbi:unnamed protein product [Bursaphelenchus okinawaensis]|uniref:C2H2-type domain-containing protein n=1 Tax=Bursaphelenchus okinawaensis TaxID=465554 RepID=A0A811KBY2_9BILA|nr:unnamed protein product [Bursaphelenchus okinawaensis]CAG9095924.1 unnamed protein product [Bursaphelenchus okinawaensis]
MSCNKDVNKKQVVEETARTLIQTDGSVQPYPMNDAVNEPGNAQGSSGLTLQPPAFPSAVFTNGGFNPLFGAGPSHLSMVGAGTIHPQMLGVGPYHSQAVPMFGPVPYHIPMFGAIHPLAYRNMYHGSHFSSIVTRRRPAETVFICPIFICGKRYSDPSSLRKHMIVKHGRQAYDLYQKVKSLRKQFM